MTNRFEDRAWQAVKRWEVMPKTNRHWLARCIAELLEEVRNEGIEEAANVCDESPFMHGYGLATHIRDLKSQLGGREGIRAHQTFLSSDGGRSK